MKNKKHVLRKAVAIALTGSACSLAMVSNAMATATTMYHAGLGLSSKETAGTTDPTSGGSWSRSYYGLTDGWTNRGRNSLDPSPIIPAQKWVGVNGSSELTTVNPFGFKGVHLNWGLEFSGGGSNAATISTYDAFQRYGIYADIDTAKGAWSDNAKLGKFGWRHDLDVGLFKTDTTGTVTLSAQGILHPENTSFGFTIFKGTGESSSYNHHGQWNAFTNDIGLTPNSLIGGGTTFTVADIVAYSVGDPATNIGSISFDAEAGQIYSIAIGGFRTGDWGDTNDGYALTVSQVPVPAAVWLMGSALFGLIGFQRRKQLAD